METSASLNNTRPHHFLSSSLMEYILFIRFRNFKASIHQFLFLYANPFWTYLHQFWFHHVIPIWTSLHQFVLFHANPFWIQLCFFLTASFVGFLVLRVLPMRGTVERPKDLDLFFMSVSAHTVSSMATVDMEAFSNSQLVVFTLLMLIGGEVFISMLALQFQKIKSTKKEASNSGASIELSSKFADQMELGSLEIRPDMSLDSRYDCVRYLGFLVLGYVLLAHVSGFALILMYLSLIPSSRAVLKGKGIHVLTFSVFTTVSSFANCGFLPTNEGMIVFRDCSGLLLMIAVLELCGNTMYPPFLRSFIWVLKKLTKRKEFDSMLRDQGVLGYEHLLPFRHSAILAFTVVAILVVQFALFCSMEWSSDGLEGMNPYRKTMGALFQSINSRSTGESIIDLSILSPAILVLYIVMMYLPPYTPFDTIQQDDRGEEGKKNKNLARNWVFSQQLYLAIVTIIICIIERRQLSDDPLNFNVLNIVFEVFSAYGNVGFSTGYSCKRQLKPNGTCKDAWYGFAGRWSNQGKLILIAVMFWGRLKKFNTRGGQAWKLN